MKKIEEIFGGVPEGVIRGIPKEIFEVLMKNQE